MITLKPTRRKHLPPPVSIRFVEIEPGSEEFHEKRLTELAQLLFDIGGRRTAR